MKNSQDQSLKDSLNLLRQHIKKRFSKDTSGHDSRHIERVVKNAIEIARKEKVDAYWVEVLAWVHELGDYKVEPGQNPQLEIKKTLMDCGFTAEQIQCVVLWSTGIGFRGGLQPKEDVAIEAAIVSDADLLDAMGAMGIARTFAYGGSKKREMYNLDIPPKSFKSQEEYTSNKGPTHNHFYEKLLHLPNYLRTNAGVELGKERHAFLKEFLARFESEM